MSSPRFAFELHTPLAHFELDLALESDVRTLGLFGASGAGKTSVLEALAGWRAIERGSIHFGELTWLDTEHGTCVAPRQRGIGYVPQDLLLFPHWSVERNLRAGAQRAAGRDDFERAVEVLELRPLLARSTLELSGGEKQRVALARALCSGPSLLLLDEPLGQLDRPLRRRILPYLLRVRDEFDVPMVVVSHDATEITALCEQVALLDRGRVIERGAPAQVFASDAGWRAVGAEFENVLAGEVRAICDATASIDLGGALLEVPRSGLEAGRRALVSVRADDVLIATERPRGLSARNVLAARIERVVVGADARVLAQIGESASIWVELTPGALRELELRAGRNLFVVIKTRSCRVLS